MISPASSKSFVVDDDRSARRNSREHQLSLPSIFDISVAVDMMNFVFFLLFPREDLSRDKKEI